MASDKIIIIDGIRWWETTSTTGLRMVQPICLQHNIRLKPVIIYKNTFEYGVRKDRAQPTSSSTELKCEKNDGHIIKIPRKFGVQKEYVIDEIDAQAFAKMPVINFDDEAIIVSSDDIKDKDNPYWVRYKVTESKAGTRLILWAGNRDSKNKTQLFIEPGIKKLSFDQNDDHPLEVFAKVDVTFAQGIKTTFTKS